MVNNGSCTACVVDTEKVPKFPHLWWIKFLSCYEQIVCELWVILCPPTPSFVPPNRKTPCTPLHRYDILGAYMAGLILTGTAAFLLECMVAPSLAFSPLSLLHPRRK